MSGPKLMELRRLRREARRQSNRERCRRYDLEYARCYAEYLEMVRVMEGLGLTLAVEVVMPERAAREAREGLMADRDEEAADRYERRLALVREEIVGGRQRIAARWLELRLRHSKLRDVVLEFMAESASLGGVEQASGDVANPAVVLEPVTLGEIEALRMDDAAGIARMEARVEQLRRQRRQVREQQARSEATAVQQAPRTSEQGGWIGRSLRDYLEGGSKGEGHDFSVGEASEVGVGFDGERGAEMKRVVAEAAALSDPRLAAELAAGFEAVGRIQDEEQRGLLEVQFLADASQRVRRVRERKAFHEEVQRLLDEAEAFPELSGNDEVLRLRGFLALEIPSEWSAIRGRIRGLIEAAWAKREREERRRAVVESLRELGYETQEGLGTAFAEAGKLVMHKGAETEYAVEVVADASLDHIQTAMVRYASSRELSEQQRLRDREREEQWCEDHAVLRRKLNERGWDANFRMQRPAGEHPVRVVVDPARAERAVADRDRRTSGQMGSREAAG